MSSSRFFQSVTSGFANTSFISATVGTSSLLNYRLAKKKEKEFIAAHPETLYAKTKCHRAGYGTHYSIDGMTKSENRNNR